LAEAKDTVIEGVIWINPERVFGALCSLGTRVPVKALFDNLGAGYALERFLDGFPGV
jgi:uncharacterized protein (DUF433 family)